MEKSGKIVKFVTGKLSRHFDEKAKDSVANENISSSSLNWQPNKTSFSSPMPHRKKVGAVVLASAGLFSVASLATSGVDPSSEQVAPSVLYYQNRYGLSDPYTKLVDNRGNGYENLYGVRNFRTILKGIAYRGGANNYYNKHRRRDNKNPLPEEGLQNLCEEGFGTGVYLYSTRYNTASHRKVCSSIRGNNHTLTYLQKSPFETRKVQEIFQMIYDRIQNQALFESTGPVYLHCWNGWHASGYISALILKQFCGVSGSAAERYWLRNTDGTGGSSAYAAFRRQIRNFRPYPQWQISPSIQADICPRM